jgi:hypothetical protein
MKACADYRSVLSEKVLMRIQEAEAMELLVRKIKRDGRIYDPAAMEWIVLAPGAAP